MKTSVLAAALLASVTVAGAAQAQDYAQGWYVSILGGPTIAPHLTYANGPAAMNTGFNAGGRVGYQLDSWLPMSGFALEADAFYNQSHYTGPTSARLSSGSLMGNLVYHFDTGTPFGVYGGAGVGAVKTSIGGNGINGSSTNLGWQALGGVDYALTNNTALFAEYRYQNAHDINISTAGHFGNTSNNVSVGVKFNL
jgi:opacity protein-like surface antigen